MATEDHDIDEVRHVNWFQDGALRRFELPAPDSAAHEGRPVGKIHLGAQVEELAHEASDLLRRQGSLLLAQILRECYTPRETYGTAFAQIVCEIVFAAGLDST